MNENDLRSRLFRFALDVIKILRTLKGGDDLKVISHQLIKAATSSGANYEEAQAAVSRTDFGYKISISLKEMRESNYWLRVLEELYKQNNEIIRLIKESAELKNILGGYVQKSVSFSLLKFNLLLDNKLCISVTKFFNELSVDWKPVKGSALPTSFVVFQG